MEVANNLVLIKEETAKVKENKMGLLESALDEQNERYHYGEVRGVGWDIKDRLKVGDRIAFDSAHGFDIKIDSEVLRLVPLHSLALVF